MKNTSLCPKCRSNDIARIEGQVGPHGAGNNIPVGWAAFGAVKVTRFLCLACGFSEEWVDDPRGMEKLRNKIR